MDQYTISPTASQRNRKVAEAKDAHKQKKSMARLTIIDVENGAPKVIHNGLPNNNV